MLNQWTNGDKSIESQLIAELYPMIQDIAQQQLRKHKQQSNYETVDVVQEAFIKLQKQNRIEWKNRSQFLAVSTQIIRRLLIDDYRAKNSQKRGNNAVQLTIDRLSSLIVGEVDVDFDLLEFDKLLQKLEKLDPEAAKIVELRFYGGFTQQEIAKTCQINLATVNSNWSFARSWLLTQLKV